VLADHLAPSCTYLNLSGCAELDPAITLAQIAKLTQLKVLLLADNAPSEIMGKVDAAQCVVNDSSIAQLGELIELEELDLSGTGKSLTAKGVTNLARLMKAEEAAGILRTLEAMLPVAQASGDLKVLRRLNADEAVKIIAEANGVPAKALRTDDELAAMDAAEQLSIPSEKLNVWGGAISLGHPIGASGARIVVTLVNALHRLGKKRGMAGICIGGGEATALCIEKL
jgi:hypothetical protein